MLERLLTEQANPASDQIDRLSTLDMLAVINREDATVAEAVRLELPRIAQAVDGISAALARGGRLIYIGAGTSGRLGVLDASECNPTYSTPLEMVQGIIAGGYDALYRPTEATEDNPGSGVADVRARDITSADVICGIAASGRTPYVLGAVRYARSLGSLTVGVSCVPDSQLAAEVDIAITPVTGPEVVTGSTRMKAGTATKLVLNMLTTGAMIRLGMTYGNRMVNVQPRNSKLIDRARRIIGSAVPADPDTAATLLEASGHSVRVAIVMGRLGIGRTEAEQRLAQAGNVVARALGEKEE
ncbi:MAG: N-acetylmuramic acid 6-phosphate etherase [Bryobacterales bacterium]|nr:N-acetylmuramic acid 6-phosphate etherase [Bryobacterales bacterium]